jgi:hypothetical protein
MDDCWDNVWINPITGLPHYISANAILNETNVVTTMSLENSNNTFKTNKYCKFCANKYGIVSKQATTHNVMNCYLLKNTTCLKCGNKGHTASYCKKTPLQKVYHEKPVSDFKPLYILDKIGIDFLP